MVFAKDTTINPIKDLLNQCALVNNSTSKQITLPTFSDLSKALDLIKTDALLNKLNYYMISGELSIDDLPVIF